MSFLIWLLVLFLCQSIQSVTHTIGEEQRHIVIIVASYNNKAYFKTHFFSVLNQQYSNYHILYTDDCSNDGMSELIEEYFESIPGMRDKIIYIRNVKRMNALSNQYYMMHMCRDTDLVILLDGDDWFSNNDVLSYINNIYKDNNVWMTYGQFRIVPGNRIGFCKQIPKEVIKNNTHREMLSVPSHLKTFYAGLFHQINKEDLLYNGEFFTMTGDYAKMLPILEMAGTRSKFISRVLMIYNLNNSLNDHKISWDKQSYFSGVIRSRGKYEEVKTPFWMASRNEKE